VFLQGLVAFAHENGSTIDEAAAKAFIERETKAYYMEIDNLATFLLEFRYGLPNHVHILHDAGYVLGFSKFLLHEVGIIPKEQFVTDNTPLKFQKEIAENLASTSEKRKIPVYFEPDAGEAQNIIRKFFHSGRGLIIGSGWDKELAEEKGYDFLSAAIPTPYRLVMITNYAGFTGGLHVIEDIYHNVLGTYK
jgi:nitrogenase molybdenum-iron protein beta chain